MGPARQLLSQESVQYAAPEPIYFIVAALLIGLLTRTVAAAWPRRLPTLPVPFTGLMFVWGALVGLANEGGAEVAHMHGGITAWTNMEPDLIFAVFLPILVFGSALGMEWHKFKRLLPDILLLAILGTLYNAALITCVARWVFPYNWKWSEACLFGAIVSAIDPIAVVALIKSVGASATLGTVIEGESLLNDGVAYVLYEIFRKWQGGEALTGRSVVSFTFQACLGGTGLGLAFGLACTAWLAFFFEDSVGEAWVLLVTSISCFLLSDEVLHTSGILALTACGLFMAAVGKHHVSAGARAQVDFFWDWADWTANVLIFFLSGGIVVAETYRATGAAMLMGRDWAYSVALWGLLIAIRGSMVLLLFPLLQRIGYGLSWRDAIMLTWAGLRGSVGLVLALSVLNSSELGSLQYRTLVFFHMAVQSGLTLLVQGTTTQPLLRLLGFLDLHPVQKDAMRHAAQAVEEYGKQEQEEEEEEGADPRRSLLGAPDWKKVEKLSALDIVSIVERRPTSEGDGLRRRWQRRLAVSAGESSKKKGGAGEPAGPADLDHQAQLEDVRTRLLGVARSAHHEMFQARIISASTFTRLEESTEGALDQVDQGLLSWRALHSSMHWRSLLERLHGHLARWTFCRTLGRLSGWVLHQAVQREAAAAAAFIHGQRYARAQLGAFEAVEEDLEAPGGGGGRAPLGRQEQGQASVYPLPLSGEADRHSILADVLGRIHSQNAGQEQGVAPSNGTGERQPPPQAQAAGHCADGGERPNREPGLSEAICKALAQVLEESVAAEGEASGHLDDLVHRYPRAVRKLASVQVAVVLLERKQEFLEALLSAGVLEKREVGKVMELAAHRLKYIHVHYNRP